MLEIKPETTSRPLLSSFDRRVLVVIALLIAAVFSVIALGDRVGVELLRYGPSAIAHTSSSVTIEFSEPMNRDSVAPRFKLQPAVDGEINWNVSGSTLTFRPSTAFEPGMAYSVVLEPGAESQNGRKLLSDVSFGFTVRTPRVAYLAPADSSPQNIWIVDPLVPESAQQITFSPSGISNFGVSPDGTQIAFSERNSNTGTSDLKLIDLETGGLRQLTNCEDSDCTTPTWRPDGNMIAYERVDFNSDLTNVGVSPTRIWLIDLTSTPISTRPLFSDSQMLGYAPQWSADGSRLALFDRNQGILIYNFASGGGNENLFLVPSNYGTVGALSPSGLRLVFPEIILDGSIARSYLRMASLETQDLTSLSNPDDPVDDDTAAWNPDNQHIAIARRYLDNRYTRGRQIYLMDSEDGSVEPLVVDDRYANGFFSWDPTGTQLVIQRFPELDEEGLPNNNGRPEIWTYDMETDGLVQVATNAYHPRWAP